MEVGEARDEAAAAGRRGRVLSVPASMVQSVREGKMRFVQHANATAFCDTAAADPWAIVERISDEMISDVLQALSEELGADCDAVVDSLVAGELH